MSVKLNRAGFEYAKSLVESRKAVRDQKDDWSEHQPSVAEENRVIDEHGFAEYGKRHLGVDDEGNEKPKKRYKFPYGDVRKVHRCAVPAVESRAGQYKYTDIELAAVHLHGMIDALS